MNRLFVVAVLAAWVTFTPHVSFAGPFDACTLESRVDKRQSGRMIWKNLGAHFNQAVIVVPRRFFPIPPKVELFTQDEKRIEFAQVKSTGVCPGHPECLFAATFLTKRSGAYYQRRHGSILVKFTPAKITKKAPGCWVYPIPNPKNRHEYRG